jgi:hypothetical protein
MECPQLWRSIGQGRHRERHQVTGPRRASSSRQRTRLANACWLNREGDQVPRSQGSQTGSQRRQASGHIRRQPAMVCAARWPIRPRPATWSDAANFRMPLTQPRPNRFASTVSSPHGRWPGRPGMHKPACRTKPDVSRIARWSTLEPDLSQVCAGHGGPNQCPINQSTSNLAVRDAEALMRQAETSIAGQHRGGCFCRDEVRQCS